MRIRVTVRFALYEKRKREHIERGYQIAEEQPIPVNGSCSFVVVTEPHSSDDLTYLVKGARADS